MPHSEISGSQDICSSPKLIAAYRVLRRLLMPRHSPCALSSLTCSSQSPLCSVSALRRNLRPLPCSSLPTKTRFAGLFVGRGRELRSLRDVSEKLVLLKNYAGFTKIEIVIVTLHPFGCCSTIKICLPRLLTQQPLCCLTSYMSHCSVFKVRLFPASFEARSQSPVSWALRSDSKCRLWWARVGSNHRPYDYQSYALAS